MELCGKQEYWSGLPRPPPGDLSNPGVKPLSPMPPAFVGRFFTTEPPGKSSSLYLCIFHVCEGNSKAVTLLYLEVDGPIFLRWEDPLEKEMATQPSIVAWEISQTEWPGRL